MMCSLHFYRQEDLTCDKVSALLLAEGLDIHVISLCSYLWMSCLNYIVAFVSTSQLINLYIYKEKSSQYSKQENLHAHKNVLFYR